MLVLSNGLEWWLAERVVLRNFQYLRANGTLQITSCLHVFVFHSEYSSTTVSVSLLGSTTAVLRRRRNRFAFLAVHFSKKSRNNLLASFLHFDVCISTPFSCSVSILPFVTGPLCRTIFHCPTLCNHSLCRGGASLLELTSAQKKALTCGYLILLRRCERIETVIPFQTTSTYLKNVGVPSCSRRELIMSSVVSRLPCQDDYPWSLEINGTHISEIYYLLWTFRKTALGSACFFTTIFIPMETGL